MDTQIQQKRKNIKMVKITSKEGLIESEAKYRNASTSMECMAWANGTGYTEIAETIIQDKNGPWVTPLYLIITRHRVIHGISNLTRMAADYLHPMLEDGTIDILSICACMEQDAISLKTLIRSYDPAFSFLGFFEYTNDQIVEDYIPEDDISSGNLIIPDEIRNFSYSEEQLKKHDKAFAEQRKILEGSTFEKPFLNQIEHYEPKTLWMPEDSTDLIYDLRTTDMKMETIAPYEQFTEIFREVMTLVNGTEYYHYVTVIQGEEPVEQFMAYLENHLHLNYVSRDKMAQEDVPAMLQKLYRALFQLYVIQDLIDDPKVTDIKITSPHSIRARVKGKAYISNIDFIDDNDYKRFINALTIKNHVKQSTPVQTFTDQRDERYILRFSLTAPYVVMDDWPYLHIRKIPRKKMLAKELMAAGMFDEKIRDYLLDCGRNSRGVIFCGQPGSGKTFALNWFLEEAYEQSAEILVIQENDELFTYRKGIMFEHVVQYPSGEEQSVSLESLGQNALVAGCNVFVIGEVKGAEICSAITLANSGCRTAMTIHSNSSTEAIDKGADLALRGGLARSFSESKRQLQCFQTLVFLEGFKIKEISEIIGYNDKTHDMIYRYIYRREEEDQTTKLLKAQQFRDENPGASTSAA